MERVRSRVHLSAYKLAEWLAWHWWRQRWEPHSDAPDWAMAHRLTTIGGGYVWPNVSVISDGEHILLVAKPTELNAAEPLHYIADLVVVVRAVEFEDVVSRFIEQVRGQLRAKAIERTNLDHVWDDVCSERQDAETVTRRRMEALLGFDPDEADSALLERLVIEAEALGECAVRELAAMSSGRGEVPTADNLQEIAGCMGYDSRPSDVVRLRGKADLPSIGHVAAWRRGAKAAQVLRAQEKLGSAPILDKLLANMAGVASETLDELTRGSDLSFSMDNSEDSGRVVLRSKWKTGRRFDLTRLLGDRIAGGASEPLLPATRTRTYRQKLQRSFAAEFLCPFEALEDMLQGDYSEEMQEEAANYFNVSSLTVRTLLVNHSRIDRDHLDGEFETALTV
ncbi:hypothetical protein NKDENANG_02308 [Candidatus Entotheonellaceae bacterium PAL068K]